MAQASWASLFQSRVFRRSARECCQWRHASPHSDRQRNGTKRYLAEGIGSLQSKGVKYEVFPDVHPDPDMECIRNGVEICNAFQPDIMICLGGGSPIDAGKYIRVQYEHPDLTLEDASARFIEIRKRTCPFPLTGTKIKTLVAIPTTSGTGSEVSPFTVVTSDEGHKYPIASYRLPPDIAICDSTLCDSLPRSLVAHAGLGELSMDIPMMFSFTGFARMLLITTS